MRLRRPGNLSSPTQILALGFSAYVGLKKLRSHLQARRFHVFFGMSIVRIQGKSLLPGMFFLANSQTMRGFVAGKDACVYLYPNDAERRIIRTYIHTYIHPSIHPYIHTYIHTYITLHCMTSHCIALHCIALHCITLHYTALHCITLHSIAFHCIPLHSIAFHCIPLHSIALHCIALH